MYSFEYIQPIKNTYTMKSLKNKTAKALQAIRDIKESQNTRLFFESLDMKLTVDEEGNNRFDFDHPPLKKRIIYLEALARKAS